jgi:hypothetical protein
METILSKGCHRLEVTLPLTHPFEESDYILPVPFVDSFSNEVVSHQTPSQDAEEEVGAEVNEDEVDSPTGTLTDNSPCWMNWKAAAAEEKKRMWGIFNETGIFACACCHGQILWLADMVQSGKL